CDSNFLESDWLLGRIVDSATTATNHRLLPWKLRRSSLEREKEEN
uniref:Protein MON2 homolog n=1 Tax=Mesocestoides corti TaxID=53468 RepID=A0A5K3ESC9_MESCO